MKLFGIEFGKTSTTEFIVTALILEKHDRDIWHVVDAVEMASRQLPPGIRYVHVKSNPDRIVVGHEKGMTRDTVEDFLREKDLLV